LRNVASAKVGTYAYVNPVVAMVLGAFVGETIDLATLFAMALIVVGVAVTITSRTRVPVPAMTPRRLSTEAGATILEVSVARDVGESDQAKAQAS
jgi:hypothetical protein